MTTTNASRGILLMVLSMAAFALADTLVKLSASVLSPAQVLFYLMGGGLVMFAVMAKLSGHSLFDIRALGPVLLVRYCSEIIGMASMVLALTHVSLSTVGAITQATPILVAVGAVFFLNEKVSWRRWTCIAVGFTGVLLIVQPGAVRFDPSVLWVVSALFALSVRDLTTRMVPQDMPSTCLTTYTMIAAVPFAIIWVLYNGESLIPAETNWWVIGPMIVLGSAGYLLLIASLRMAEVSVVMPFRYTRIVFLLILGIVVFDEAPSLSMLLGAALVVASGIYMMWRQGQLDGAR